MLDQIKNLAAFIESQPERKFVLMLGAGASISSGIKPTLTIMEELVAKFAAGDSSKLVEDRFDDLWANANHERRETMLVPYLSAVPSAGYHALAKLIGRGVFDLVISFNFDRLLEAALDAAQISYRTVIRGEHELDAIPTLVKRTDPPFRLLKMHGSLRSANHFLFSKQEMLNYPTQLHDLLTELTGRDIIVCGYAFNDHCVTRAFNEQQTSGAIYSVNPSGAPGALKGFMAARGSRDRAIRDKYGEFDVFMEALYEVLYATPSAPPPARRQNFFKFLDHYSEAHRTWFYGRKHAVCELATLAADPARTRLYLSGAAKVGKTSLLRAGLVPRLEDRRFIPVYVRCSDDLQKSVGEALEAKGIASGSSTLAAGLAALKSSAATRAVLILDQFERVSRAWTQQGTAKARQTMLDLQALVGAADHRLYVVLSAVDESPFWKFIVDSHLPGAYDKHELKPLKGRMLKAIIHHAAKCGGVPLDGKVVARLVAEYEGTSREPSSRTEGRSFTLNHVQTFCYYQARSSLRGSATQELSHPVLIAALESAKNNVSLVDLLDDLPAEERSLFRCLLRVICDPSNSNSRGIIEFMRDRFPEIRQDAFPEQIV